MVCVALSNVFIKPCVVEHIWIFSEFCLKRFDFHFSFVQGSISHTYFCGSKRKIEISLVFTINLHMCLSKQCVIGFNNQLGFNVCLPQWIYTPLTLFVVVFQQWFRFHFSCRQRSISETFSFQNGYFTTFWFFKTDFWHRLYRIYFTKLYDILHTCVYLRLCVCTPLSASDVNCILLL